MKVAVLGATGAVGQELLRVLQRRSFPVDELFLLASSRSAGRKIVFGDTEVLVQDAEGFDFRKSDMVFCCLDASSAGRFVPRALEAGCVVVDNSSAYRMEHWVPLVVPEINAHRIKPPLVSNPNCTTAITLLPLAPLHNRWRITHIFAATYQAASGAGAAAMEELLSHTKAALKGETPQPFAFPKTIAFNLFPHVGGLEGDYSEEEMKLERESRKILEDDKIKVSCFCVRVPVLRAHSVAAFVRFEEEPNPAEARSILAETQGVEIKEPYPTPKDAEGKDVVFVGRIRKDRALECGVSLWIVGDQLLKGAALNAVQIGEILLEAAR